VLVKDMVLYAYSKKLLVNILFSAFHIIATDIDVWNGGVGFEVFKDTFKIT
jgi:hypothetical protein